MFATGSEVLGKWDIWADDGMRSEGIEKVSRTLMIKLGA